MGSVKEGAKGVGAILGTIFIFLGILAIVGGVIWGFGVLTSGPKGQGDAIAKNNSAENWTKKQALFEDLNQEVLAADRKIGTTAEELKANPKDEVTKRNLAGLKSGCEDIVAQYNAESKKFLSQDWKSIDLPATIDGSDPATDCK